MKKRSLFLQIFLVCFLGVSTSMLSMNELKLPKTQEIKIQEDKKSDFLYKIIKWFIDRKKIEKFAKKFANYEEAIKQSREFFTKKYPKGFSQLYESVCKVFPQLNGHKEVLEMLVDEYIKYYIAKILLKKGPLSKLFWCECKNAYAETRFYLILHLLDSVLASNIDKNKKLGFISFGSGSLFMEYLTIKALLKLGFTKINLYAIDVAYIDKESFGSKALGAFQELLRNYPGVKLRSYPYRYDFLTYWTPRKQEKWEAKERTIIQLIDPYFPRGKDPEREGSMIKNPNVADIFSVFVATKKKVMDEALGFEFDEIVKKIASFEPILPFFGKPRIFYKEGEIAEFLKKPLLSYLSSSGYRGYQDRKKFFDGLKNLLKKEVKKHFQLQEGQWLNIDFTYEINQGKAFDDLVEHAASNNSFIYRLFEGNKIFIGGDKSVGNFPGKIYEYRGRVQELIKERYVELKSE